MNRLLFLAQLGTTLPLVGLIWTIQLVHYPMLSQLDPASFVEAHAQHSLRISVLVIPLMLIELAAVILFVLWPPSGPHASKLALLGLALVAVAWLSTFLLQVPIHEQLAQADPAAGETVALVDRLVFTNWIRTAAWTLRGILLLMLLSRPQWTS